jgi:gliding motility-associated-like protein
MKKLFFLLLIFSSFFGYCQYTAIPDVNFEKALISQGIDSGMPDGRVLTSNVTGVTFLSLDKRNITSLMGLQDFVSLTSLFCSINNITSLDVTKNNSLSYLSCFENQITNLDLTKNTSLISLVCSNNLNSSLDISNSLSLTYLACSFNKISSLDVTNNTKLTNLYCTTNLLTNLDVSKNISLIDLSCWENQLKSLDVSKNTSLNLLYCDDNQLNSMNLKNENNTKLTNVGFTKNSNLTCIQVDNKSYSDTNWSALKDASASFSEDCGYKTSAPVTPPQITATGNQIYCPGTPLKIVETISITPDPAEPTTDAVYIQISSGYVSGQDLLTLTGIHPNVSSNWSQLEGKLNLYSTTGNKIPYSEFEAAIKDVTFDNNSASISGTRNFSITIGQANYLPSTGHYYQFISDLGITWSNAKTAAEALNYYGLKGYLATILSLEEAKIAGEQASGAGWIGGSDAETEGVWKWVTGPESGTIFWNGLGDGNTPNFAYWNTNNNEPNNFGDEDFAHITALGVGIPGSWNDLTNTGNLNSGNPYQPKGFIVEYGGMPGDPILKISASTSLTVGKIEIVSTPSPICNSGTATFKASANGLPIKWYDSLIGGNLVGTANDFTTPILTSDKSYFADAGCTSTPRTEFKVIVNAIPKITATTTSVSRCGPGSVVLDAVTSAGTINWYNALTGGSLQGTGNSFKTADISADTTFYAEADNNGCLSDFRIPIKVIVYPTPQVSDQEIIKCKLIDKELDAELTGMSYLWSTGETTQKIAVSTPGIFTVEVTSPAPENCKSTKKITVLENNIPEIDRIETTETSAIIYVKQEEIYFEFSIDGINYQASNVFLNVPIGSQTAYVRDINRCRLIEQDFTIFRIKKYFSPNNDGINDLWEINDMKNFPNSSASIYDRYGKLIIILNASKYSWDGNFNNNPLPADDYWFRLKLDNSKPEVKGHFSLKR